MLKLTIFARVSKWPRILWFLSIVTRKESATPIRHDRENTNIHRLGGSKSDCAAKTCWKDRPVNRIYLRNRRITYFFKF